MKFLISFFLTVIFMAPLTVQADDYYEPSYAVESQTVESVPPAAVPVQPADFKSVGNLDDYFKSTVYTTVKAMSGLVTWGSGGNPIGMIRHQVS